MIREERLQLTAAIIFAGMLAHPCIENNEPPTDYATAAVRFARRIEDAVAKEIAQCP